MEKLRWGGIWDFGGGDQALRLIVEAQPDMPEPVEQEGLAIVAAYLFSPRLDDLAFLKTFERMGYRPRATALILNLGEADGPSAFNDIRRRPEYKAALDRGAVELWLPLLNQRVALAIEKDRILFGQARDGIVPDGKRLADISLIERVAVREWLMRTEAEFKDIEQAGWMPWTSASGDRLGAGGSGAGRGVAVSARRPVSLHHGGSVRRAWRVRQEHPALGTGGG
jgi:hypothetical protein